MLSECHCADAEDETACSDAPSDLVKATLVLACVVALRQGCSVIDRGADLWEPDATSTICLNWHTATTVRSSRERIADAIFFILMGAIVGYAMLLASGGLYRGKPDFVDTLLWRHIKRDGRVASVADGITNTKKGSQRRGASDLLRVIS